MREGVGNLTMGLQHLQRDRFAGRHPKNNRQRQKQDSAKGRRRSDKKKASLRLQQGKSDIEPFLSSTRHGT